MLRAFASIIAPLAAAALCAACGVASAAAPATQTVAGARVSAVADAIARGAAGGEDRLVAPAYAVADQTIPAGAVRIAAAGTPFVSATYVGVPVAISVDGRLARTVVAGYRVTAYMRTAVAAHDLAPGAVLTADDLTLARIAANGRPAVAPDALVGRKLTAAAARGAALYVEATVPDTLVKAGQAAVLVVRDGPVALSADVVARTGGALGDTVTVFNPQTQRAIAAIVTGKNRVELTLTDAEASR